MTRKTKDSATIQKLARTICFVLVLLCAASATAKIDFNRDIRPILSSKCIACHGPDEAAREADLRLDTHEGATESVVDLEDPLESELLARVASSDPDMIMPPPGHGERLTDAEQLRLRQWIEQGAVYAKHWSYAPPVSPKVPTTMLGIQHNEIDAFVQDRLAAANTGLMPARPADRRTIIRRVALDLTGLPPTREEVAAFLADQSDGAYETIVDSYLKSDAFGERWASMWLDLARYADSAGYADDRKRTIWAFRDYVIRAYNQNKSFRQFTLEQIAGDLFETPTIETLTATAFHRNTLTNSEGGTSDEEFRSAAVVDRVNTTMAVWMGTTMACAQCHTHKYDPITQTEYFQFYDFFNQSEDNDRPDESPTIPVISQSDLQKKQRIESEIKKRKEEIASGITDSERREWIDSIRDSPLSEVVGRYVRVDLPRKSAFLSLAEVEVFSSDTTGKETNVARNGKASQSSTAFAGPAKYAVDGSTNGNFTDKSVTHTGREDDPWWQVDLKKETSINRIVTWHRTDNGLFKRSDGFRLSILDGNQKVVWSRDYQKAASTNQVAKVQDVPAEIIRLANLDSRDERQQAKLSDFYQTIQTRDDMRLRELQAELNVLKPGSTVPVMRERSQKMRRVTKVQVRGNYLDTSDTVVAATPAAFHPLPEAPKRDRMALAQWLVDENNPLTARVVVNRYWEQLFGTGLVATSEEFGSQGEMPSHPRLLDWLATDLVEHGWDTQRLLKQMVMSGTYRQSSFADDAALATDPDNRLLARGPRTRLSAEMIRDQALAVSGLLSRKMYGPPVHPPQPKVGLKPAFSGQTTNWDDSMGDDRYRRAVYTEWRRSAPYPSMATFDMNSREVCEVRRTSTNTPLQALVTLNDPVYIEAAQALARTVSGVPDAATLSDKIAAAFQTCLIRLPTEQERMRLDRLASQTKAHFRANPESAKQLATDPLNPPDKNADMVELATLTTIANVLLNLDEMLMKP